MTGFALLNIAEAGEAVPAIKVGDQVLPVGAALAAVGQTSALPANSTKAILCAWPVAEPALGAIASAFAGGASKVLRALAKPLASVRLAAPILYPDAIFCAFANYTDHMREKSGRDPPDKSTVKPLFFPEAGQELTVEIEQIGRLHNPIVQGE